ncbi:MAG: amidohydrolase family protein [Bacteroidota bacterium]|nr:amidohydrolase family protein [Bacteroidota bacterium]
MSYRKFRADQLFTGHEMRQDDSVLVTTEDGVVETILPLADAGEGVEQLPGLLTPGFVNCHCHLELSHLRGAIPEGIGLVNFILAVLKQRGAAPNTIQSAIKAAEDAMLDEGIVAVGDICNTTDSLPQKASGRIYYHNFIEGMGFTPEGAQGRFEAICRLFSAFAEAYPLPIETNSLTPHAPYSVSPELFRLIAGFPGNHLLSMHNQESEAENEFCLQGTGDFLRLYSALGIDIGHFKGTGQRSLGACLAHFYRNQSLILVHNLYTSEEDLRAIRGYPGLYYCLCPHANQYISGRLPDPELFMRHDAIIVLGTDSLASNHRLSILDEIRILERNYPRLPLATLLQWATSNGAQALQMDGLLGSFERGKQPGIVLISHMEGARLGREAVSRRVL